MRATGAILLVLLASAGCRDEASAPAAPAGSAAALPPDPPPQPDKIVGALTVDGVGQTLTTCRTGRATTTYVELVTAAGILRFENRKLWWRTDPGAVTAGTALDCPRLERSWGGGARADGSAYFRGRLIFDCRGVAGPAGVPVVRGDVSVDCGRITAAERRELDRNRELRRGPEVTPNP